MGINKCEHIRFKVRFSLGNIIVSINKCEHIRFKVRFGLG